MPAGGDVHIVDWLDRNPDACMVVIDVFELVRHLLALVGAAPGALVFTGPEGAALRRGNFNTLVRWIETVGKLGMQGLALPRPAPHRQPACGTDRRQHQDLMARMGHDDMRAALIYQRATSKADRQIAERLARLVDEHQVGAGDDEDDDGTGPTGVPVPAG